MPTEITISSISGTTPFDVYICNDPITTCIYVDTISSAPYTFNVPSLLNNQSSYYLRIIDNNGCKIEENLTL